MNPTIKAILARFDGDEINARVYCLDIATTASNPALRNEYWNLALEFGESAPRSVGAHA